MPTYGVVLTYRDYELLPDDGRRYEILEGKLTGTPAPSPRHQRVSRNLYDVVGKHVRERRLGEVFYAPIDVILEDTTIVQPDLVYLDPARAGLVSDRGIEGPPALVVEILSPATSLVDRSRKSQLYARHGVPHYWIVDPEARTLEVYGLAEAGYRLIRRVSGSAPEAMPPFPDLAFAPDSLWP